MGFQFRANWMALTSKPKKLKPIIKYGKRSTVDLPKNDLKINEKFSEKINEKDRSFSSRSEKTIPQFENKTLLEDSR